MTVTLAEAKERLEELARVVDRDDEVLITKPGKPAYRLEAGSEPAPRERKRGLWAGRASDSEHCWDPMSEEELGHLEGPLLRMEDTSHSGRDRILSNRHSGAARISVFALASAVWLFALRLVAEEQTTSNTEILAAPE